MTADRIRMLFIPNETYPTSRVDVTLLFGRELHSRGHRIDFVMQAGTTDATLNAEGWEGSRVLLGPTDTRPGIVHEVRRDLLSFWHDLRYLARLRRSEYNAVQVRDKFLIAAVAVVFARVRRVPFFYWLSFPKPEMQLLRASQGRARYRLLLGLRARLFSWLLYRWILPRSDHVFVQSAVMKRNICARGIDPARVTPVPMGVDLADVDAARRLPRTRSGAAVRLAYLGTAAADRHLEILVDMLAILRNGGMDASLIIIGDATEARDRHALEEHARNRGVAGYLRITGFLPRLQALELAADADVCLSPIFPAPVFMVASPTKLVEYMALGVPVVANDHPEQRAVLQQSRAGVCVPWGARHFARAVRWIMKRSWEERAAMGTRGCEWVIAHRTYRRIADDIERIYLETVGHHQPGAQQ
jgi:glycosyltransferase involved in cell wall biosynthesis